MNSSSTLNPSTPDREADTQPLVLTVRDLWKSYGVKRRLCSASIRCHR